MQKRAIWMSLLLVSLFFALNHSWTHAAMGAVFRGSTCPPELVSAAHVRVQALFGEAISTPLFACLPHASMGLDVAYGSARFAPGLPSLLVVGPKGLNVDVMAHEWAHAELAERTSALLRTYKVPTWFDEGLAMQLDHRVAYDREALSNHVAAGLLAQTSLQDIATPAGFFVSGQQGAAHYAVAKCVVASWLRRMRDPGAVNLIARVNWWTGFPSDDFKPDLAVCLSPDHRCVFGDAKNRL